VIDDPDLAVGVGADRDLVEFRVVIDGVGVHEVRAGVPVIILGHVTELLEPGDPLGRDAGWKRTAPAIDVDALGMLRGIAVVG
jgi:hypothetical protein